MNRPVRGDEGPRPESPTKGQRSGAIQSEKRKGDSIEKLAEMQKDKLGLSSKAQAVQVRERSRPEETPTSILEIASLVEEYVCSEDSMGIALELHALGASKTDIAEIYSPERFTSRANEFGLRPGFAIDFSVQKSPGGDFWDLSRSRDIEELFKLLHRTKPLLLVGSPICGPFSPLQNLRKYKRDPREFEKVQREGRKHLHTSIDAYWTQLNSGRLFLHEHPKWASSWRDVRMIELQSDPRVYTISGPMCRWEMLGEDAKGVGYVRKETQFVTNSKVLATLLEGTCEGGHRHVHLINGRARFAQVYPPKLVRGVLKAVRQELLKRGELNSVTEKLGGVGPVPDGESNEPTENPAPTTEFEEDDEEAICDSVTGKPVPRQEVWKAREEELQWVEKQQIYEPADIDEAWEVTGKCTHHTQMGGQKQGRLEPSELSLKIGGQRS